jgi:hypothetical protein
MTLSILAVERQHLIRVSLGRVTHFANKSQTHRRSVESSDALDSHPTRSTRHRYKQPSFCNLQVAARTAGHLERPSRVGSADQPSLLTVFTLATEIPLV